MDHVLVFDKWQKLKSSGELENLFSIDGVIPDKITDGDFGYFKLGDRKIKRIFLEQNNFIQAVCPCDECFKKNLRGGISIANFGRDVNKSKEYHILGNIANL